MLTTFFNFMHLAPLALIAILVFAPKLKYSLIPQKFFNAAMLILASIGIIAGAFDHHHIEYLIDPCIGYAATLLYVAFRTTQTQAEKILQK